MYTSTRNKIANKMFKNALLLVYVILNVLFPCSEILKFTGVDDDSAKQLLPSFGPPPYSSMGDIGERYAHTMCCK